MSTQPYTLAMPADSPEPERFYDSTDPAVGTVFLRRGGPPSLPCELTPEAHAQFVQVYRLTVTPTDTTASRGSAPAAATTTTKAKG